MSAEIALHVGIIEALRASAPLAVEIQNRIFDRVPADAAFPYVRLSYDSTAVAQDCADESVDVNVQIDVFSRAVGSVEALKIGGLVRAALNRQEIAASGYEVAHVLFRQMLKQDDPDGKTTHVIVLFDASLTTAN